MFPSCKRIAIDRTSTDNSTEWLYNKTFQGGITNENHNKNTGKKSENLLSDSITQSSEASAKPATGTRLFVIDKTADLGNVGANRSYFKTVPKYRITSQADHLTSNYDDTNGSLAPPANKIRRYFRQSCVKKQISGVQQSVGLADTEHFTAQDWISLWASEQNAFRKDLGLRTAERRTKQLQLILSRLRSFVKRHPNKQDANLRSIDFEIRKLLGESCIELVAEWRKALRSQVGFIDYAEWMLYFRFCLSSSTLHFDNIRKDFEGFVMMQLVHMEDNGGAESYEDYEKLFDGLFLYAMSLSDAGYHEMAIAFYQALIDFNVGCCIAQTEFSVKQYRQFWMTGLPRIGEVGYVEWTKCLGQLNFSSSLSSQNPVEPFHLDDDLTHPLQWLQNEATRERANILPFRNASQSLEDVERYVKFSDLILFKIPSFAMTRLFPLLMAHFVIIASPFGFYSLTSPVFSALTECVSYLYNVIAKFPAVSSRLVSECSTQSSSSTKVIALAVNQLIERTDKRPDIQRPLLLFKMSLSVTDAKSVLANHQNDIELFSS